MKIKIFSGSNLEEIEGAVNEFIKDKFVISIQHSPFIGLKISLIITVLYDDTFNCGYIKTRVDRENL